MSVPVGPVPTAFGFGEGTGPNGQRIIGVAFMTPTGQQTYFFDVEAFEKFIQQAQQMVSKIVVPTPRIIPPSAEVLEQVRKDVGRASG